MCTVTWVRQPSGYVVFCNRDEKRTRPAAMEPSIREREGVRFIAPTDSGAGGTWIAVNEFGVTLCLLNGPTVPASGRDMISRGLLVLELAGVKSTAEAYETLPQESVDRYAPFTLAVFERDRAADLAVWDGAQLSTSSLGSALGFLTSSSFDSQRVSAARLKRFEALCESGELTPALLEEFHATHDLSEGALGICMHRQDAETVSFSRVDLGPDSVRFQYMASAPCRHESVCDESLSLRV